MIAEDRNVSGSTMNWLIPIRASCWRTSSARAFDSAAKMTVSSTAATTVTEHRRGPREACAGGTGDAEHDQRSGRPR